jgi:hypothetical protein
METHRPEGPYAISYASDKKLMREHRWEPHSIAYLGIQSPELKSACWFCIIHCQRAKQQVVVIGETELAWQGAYTLRASQGARKSALNNKNKHITIGRKSRRMGV